jgi:spore germination protein YaaH
LAEQLGARVDWNSRLKEVAVYFDLASAPPVADKPTVFAYYYGSVLGELKDNAGLFTDVAFRWLETNDKGELFYEYRDDYDGVLQYTRNQGIRTHASVVFMDRAGLHTLLSTEANRNRLINNLATRARDDNYDGVNIDFEFLPVGDRDNFTRFLRDLKVRLGDKCLSVAVFACTKPESWLAGYDYQAIGSIADQIVVMAYDYSYKGSAPGPVAPLWWVEDATAYLTAIIPNEKLLLGMPTYGYDWGSGVNATTVTARRLADLDNKYGLSEHFDNKSMSPYYTYVDSNNVYHQIWLENQLSLEKKYEVAVRYNLGGVSFWRIGNGFKDLYAVLARNVE